MCYHGNQNNWAACETWNQYLWTGNLNQFRSSKWIKWQNGHCRIIEIQYTVQEHRNKEMQQVHWVVLRIIFFGIPRASSCQAKGRAKTTKIRDREPGWTQEYLIELMCPRKLWNFSAYIHAKKIYAGKFQCVQLRYSQELQSYLIAVGFYSAFSELSCMQFYLHSDIL